MCVVLEPRRFADDRGFFFESFNEARYADGRPADAVRAGQRLAIPGRACSAACITSCPIAQGKLVSVLRGEVFDVAVDIRKESPTFGKWVGVTLSSENGRQMYIPEGFAHGFLVTGDCAVFHYKCTAFYDPKSEGSIAWDDPAIGIDWPRKDVCISPKDAAACRWPIYLPTVSVCSTGDGEHGKATHLSPRRRPIKRSLRAWACHRCLILLWCPHGKDAPPTSGPVMEDGPTKIPIRRRPHWRDRLTGYESCPQWRAHVTRA